MMFTFYKLSYFSNIYDTNVLTLGMFVASCAFDKTINLFDFFSGDLVTQVTGHSELITSIRFSPDGRYLLSVGGDGCIMIWRIADLLTNAMQERLSELISSAQKRQTKMSELTVAETGPRSVTPSMSLMPPPPPYTQKPQPNPQQNPQPQSQIQSSSSSASPLVVINDVRSEIRKSIAGSVGASVASGRGRGRGSRWASRADQQEEYELFGRKMSSVPNTEKYRLTLELTNFDETTNNVLDGGNGNGNGNGMKKNEENEGAENASNYGMEYDRAASVSSDNNDNSLDNDNNDNTNDRNTITDDFNKDAYHGNKLANTLEASDSVMSFEESGSDNEKDYDDVGSLFKAELSNLTKKSEKISSSSSSSSSSSKCISNNIKPDEEYDDDFENNDEADNNNNLRENIVNHNDGDGEAYLAKASRGIDILEQSATYLENWLEDMVRSVYSTD